MFNQEIPFSPPSAAFNYVVKPSFILHHDFVLFSAEEASSFAPRVSRFAGRGRVRLSASARTFYASFRADAGVESPIRRLDFLVLVVID